MREYNGNNLKRKEAKNMKDLNLPVIIAILASGALTLYPFAMFFAL